MGDYKYKLQVMAEEAAEEEGTDYYSLPLSMQYKLYQRCKEKYFSLGVNDAVTRYDTTEGSQNYV